MVFGYKLIYSLLLPTKTFSLVHCYLYQTNNMSERKLIDYKYVDYKQCHRLKGSEFDLSALFSNINSAFQYFLTYEMPFLTVNLSKRKI